MDALISYQPLHDQPIGELCALLINEGKIESVSVHFSEMIMSSLGKDEVFNLEEQNYLRLLCILIMEQMLKQHSCVNTHRGLISNWLAYGADEMNLSIDIPKEAEIDALLNIESSLFVNVDNIKTFNPATEAVKPFVRWQNRLYLHKYFVAEWQIFKRVEQSLLQGRSCDFNAHGKAKEFVANLFVSNAVTQETDWQREAVINSMNSPFSVICGGPGTGKTTTVVKLLAGLVFNHAQGNPTQALRIAVSAPTGKAALRLEESIADALEDLQVEQTIKHLIPKSASTIHRVMGSRGNGSYAFSSSNPLPFDILLIDEASMIDVILMAKVFSALPAHCRVVLIGDRQQLASVEAGNVLGDFYQAQNRMKERFLVELKKSYRFSDQSSIGQLASAINEGRISDVLRVLYSNSGETGSVHWMRDPINELVELIEHTVEQFVKLADMLNSITKENEAVIIEQAFTLIKQQQLLCCLRKSETGTEQINRKITHRLVQKGKVPINEHHYIARPIMVTANAYNLKLYNGDIGIQCIDPVSGLLMTYFQQGKQGFAKYHCQRLPAHESVYAMTVHKSQGSEFEHAKLILPIEKDNSTSITKELVYTGLTRARKYFTLVAQEQVILSACKQKTNRQSGLAEMLL